MAYISSNFCMNGLLRTGQRIASCAPGAGATTGYCVSHCPASLSVPASAAWRQAVLPVPPVGVALAGHPPRLRRRPGGGAAARGLQHPDVALAVALQDLGRRMTEAVAVPGLHQRSAWPDGLQKRR